MATTASREAYLETGLAVLAESGYSSFKMTEICRRLGVTTGSFYHFFKNWSAYTDALLDHWYESRTEAEMAAARSDSDPWHRIEGLIDFGLTLPHGAEAAIRSWASLDATVRAVQEKADRRRYEVVHEAVTELLGDEDAAHRYASWALYLLTGYEQTSLPHDVEALEWSARHLTSALADDRKRSRRAKNAPTSTSRRTRRQSST